MHPAHDCRRVYFDATFLHPLRKITVANAVLAVPADTKQKALNRKAPTLEHGPSYRRAACEVRKYELMQQNPLISPPAFFSFPRTPCLKYPQTQTL